MDWYNWVLMFLFYCFGCGAVFSYLSNSEYDGFANIDAAMELTCTFTWPISIWFIVGSAWMSKVIDNGYLK